MQTPGQFSLQTNNPLIISAKALVISYIADTPAVPLPYKEQLLEAPSVLQPGLFFIKFGLSKMIQLSLS